MSTKKNTTMKKSDLDFYKMSGVFAIACVFIMLTLRMSATITAYRKTGANITYNVYKLCQHPATWIVGAIIAIAAVVWFVYNKKKNIDEKMKLFTSINALSLVAYLAVFAACFGITENSDKHSFFIVFTIVATVLYYISKSFHLDFIFCSTLNAIFALIIYFLAYKVSPAFIVVKALLVIGALVLCLLFRKKYATVNKARKNKKTNYLFAPVFVSLVFFAISMFIPLFARFYSPYIISASTMLTVMMMQYIVLGIVYTIRLIRE